MQFIIRQIQISVSWAIWDNSSFTQSIAAIDLGSFFCVCVCVCVCVLLIMYLQKTHRYTVSDNMFKNTLWEETVCVDNKISIIHTHTHIYTYIYTYMCVYIYMYIGPHIYYFKDHCQFRRRITLCKQPPAPVPSIWRWRVLRGVALLINSRGPRITCPVLAGATSLI